MNQEIAVRESGAILRSNQKTCKVDRRAVVLFHGLGDTITSVHLMNAHLRGDENFLIQCSYRGAFINSFLDLVVPHLPKPTEVFQDEEFQSVFSPRLGKVTEKYRCLYPELNTVKIRREGAITSLMQRYKFDFRRLLSLVPDIPKAPYAIISVDVLKKDRTAKSSDWLWLDAYLRESGLQRVIVGKRSISQIDRVFGRDIECEFPDDVIDLREKTSMQQFIDIVAHAEAVFCPVNAVAHLAWELKRPALCLGAREKRPNYEGLYFPGIQKQRRFNINYDRQRFRKECKKLMQMHLA